MRRVGCRNKVEFGKSAMRKAGELSAEVEPAQEAVSGRLDVKLELWACFLLRVAGALGLFLVHGSIPGHVNRYFAPEATPWAVRPRLAIEGVTSIHASGRCPMGTTGCAAMAVRQGLCI